MDILRDGTCEGIQFITLLSSCKYGTTTLHHPTSSGNTKHEK